MFPPTKICLETTLINGAEAEPLGIVLYFAGEHVSPTIRASMTIKAVLLDFDQTLADSAEGFRLAEKNAETSIFEDLGLASWEDFLSDYRKFRNELHERSNFSRNALWQAIYLHYEREASPDLLAELEYDYWESVRLKTMLFPETIAVLEHLATAYRLALITNTQGQGFSGAHRANKFHDLEPFFDIIIEAGFAGIRPKPNPEPFLLCLERLDIVPSEAVFVGDDLRNDIQGSQAVGIQPVWLKHHSIARIWPEGDTSVPVIYNLDQIIPILEKI
jgi:HAD superfamily hydrolase (TIGR01549 family)